MSKVVIEVYEGVALVVDNPDDVEVVIVDWDNPRTCSLCGDTLPSGGDYLDCKCGYTVCTRHDIHRCLHCGAQL